MNNALTSPMPRSTTVTTSPSRMISPLLMASGGLWITHYAAQIVAGLITG